MRLQELSGSFRPPPLFRPTHTALFDKANLGSLRRKEQRSLNRPGIATLRVVMVYGTLDLQEIVRGQGRYLGGVVPLWGILAQPVAFFVFLTAALAETKRVPFDLPEGESEIIRYLVEYSGMKFGMFFLADFTWSRPPQRPQTRGSTSYTRRIRSAHLRLNAALRAGLRVGSSAG